MRALDDSAFLTDPDRIRSCAQDICGTKGELRLAIAFWGKGAMDSLRLGNRKPAETRILLNAESGACNPSELIALLARFGDCVRTDDALHAKVYLAESLVLAGSANASANGLGREGDAAFHGWAEACLVAASPNEINKAITWFDERWKIARPLTAELIESIRPIWERAQATAASRPNPGGLDVYVVNSTSQSTEQARAMLRKMSTDAKRVSGYQKWKPPAGALLLDFDSSTTGRPVYTGAWISSNPQQAQTQRGIGGTVYIVDEAPALRKEQLCKDAKWSSSDAAALGALSLAVHALNDGSARRRVRAALRSLGLRSNITFTVAPDDFCLPLNVFNAIVDGKI